MSNPVTSNDQQFNIAIQTFSSEYTQEVGELISTIQRQEFEIPITLEQQPDLADIPGFYQTRKGNFWIALSNDRVVGTISLLDIGNNQVALRKMFVDSEYRGSRFGIAHKLLESTFNWCRSESISEIYLGTTAKFLAAHRFYEKNGFAQIPKENLPTAFPVMAVDTRFYQFTV